MGIIRYVRWRLSPAGRAVYRSYARAMGPQGHRARARAEARAAVRRDRDAPAMRVTRVTDLWGDGRTRVTDVDYRTGRKTRVHETRNRSKDADGLRPRQRRTR